MSEENVENVREGIAAYDRGDLITLPTANERWVRVSIGPGPHR
ncbi:MAG: hypothetical protein ABIZ50_00095 [Solirubrobacterales bacterium]